MTYDTTEGCSLGIVDRIGDHPAENVFLTEQKKKEIAGSALGVDRCWLDQMEILDKQLENVELECKQSDALAGIEHDLDDTVKCESTSFDLDFPSSENQSNGLATTSDVDLLLGLEDSEAVDERKILLVDKHDNFPLLEFPVAIDIEDIVPTSSSDMSCISFMNAQSMHGSVQRSIERNKSLCSVGGGNNLLTVEEEERISELLLEEDGDVEKYGCMPSTEEEREVELDSILLGLGYNIENNDGDNAGIEERKEDEGTKTSNEPRGDPVLRELAKNRALSEHEMSIDQALRALLREPLPPVIRIPEDGITEGEDGVSLLSSIFGGTTLTAAMTEEDMQTLIQRVKHELQEDELELADHQSVRALAQATRRSWQRERFIS
eukprot:CAMPEP_0201932800 /NCGR_PEP_ID=MMETSP0903-20130614/30221_1 /ASSEMBLY_ACC=CAM_ASM_000552 /TAXON_ID=420261 /ORGANISM="Thalassiosira antarctica, Strain CCMP982" /LENGTH=378 /DNA_ID=CAMNT_0048472537 /DNA_START=2345 /DNA_END=3478 /DNA_ORIENTATION=-